MILYCPNCNSYLSFYTGGAECHNCNYSYFYKDDKLIPYTWWEKGLTINVNFIKGR